MGEVTYEAAEGVAVITLNRPERLNAWTAAMAAGLRSALERAEADADVRAIVLTGAGRGFCAGADMDLLQDLAEAMADADHEMALSLKSADFKEGVASFVEKRQVRFTGT